MIDEIEVGDLIEYKHDHGVYKQWILSYHQLKTMKAMIESGHYILLRYCKYSTIEFEETEEYKKLSKTEE